MGNPPQRKMPLTGATDRRTFMEQERNPNKNAELAMEQNGNMIDGIINNLPVPPPECESIVETEKKMTKGARREIVRCEQTDRTLLRDLPSQ